MDESFMKLEEITINILKELEKEYATRLEDFNEIDFKKPLPQPVFLYRYVVEAISSAETPKIEILGSEHDSLFFKGGFYQMAPSNQKFCFETFGISPESIGSFIYNISINILGGIIAYKITSLFDAQKKIKEQMDQKKVDNQIQLAILNDFLPHIYGRGEKLLKADIILTNDEKEIIKKIPSDQAISKIILLGMTNKNEVIFDKSMNNLKEMGLIDEPFPNKFVLSKIFMERPPVIVTQTEMEELAINSAFTNLEEKKEQKEEIKEKYNDEKFINETLLELFDIANIHYIQGSYNKCLSYLYAICHLSLSSNDIRFIHLEKIINNPSELFKNQDFLKQAFPIIEKIINAIRHNLDSDYNREMSNLILLTHLRDFGR